MSTITTTTLGFVTHPVPTPGLTAPQLDPYSYSATSVVFGSNIKAAWAYSTGYTSTIAVIDDGFDPTRTALFGFFSTSLSRNFGAAGATNLAEPTGDFHGTTTSGLIGDSGTGGQPVGLAPNATIIGVKVDVGTVPLSEYVNALNYASADASVINNSWGLTGFGAGEPSNTAYATWYSALQKAVSTGRADMGSVIVFAAGDGRAQANDLALQPIPADPRVIAVAASDADGQVASYSTGGAALLVAAIGDNVAVPMPAGQAPGYVSGTSYSAASVSAIVGQMLSVNPNLGWRDVQEILADSAYMPAPSAASFTFNGATFWNGGGMHFSNDLGFGVVDANVAVNLARAWPANNWSDSSNLVTTTVTQSAATTVGINATADSSLSFASDLRIQHVQVTIHDTNLLAVHTELVLISPDGTHSVLLDRPGVVGGIDATGGLDLSGDVITSNAFWGESSTGTWTLQVQDVNGNAIGTIQNWNLTVWGDTTPTISNPAAIATMPMVFTPEYALLSAAAPTRTVINPTGYSTIDLIALPGTTSINLNGGASVIDGVNVTLLPGLTSANATGSTGSVTLYGANGGGTLTGGDGPTTIYGVGKDKIVAGLGSTVINTGTGGSALDLTRAMSGTVENVTSGGGDSFTAGNGTVSIQDIGAMGDTIWADGSHLTFINGSGSSMIFKGTGTVLIEGGIGGGTFYAGTGGSSTLTAGTGMVTLYGEANGDVLTAAGTANDKLIAGAGSETLNGGSASGNITLTGGSGSDAMTAGTGHTTFAVGKGNDSITTGGIADVIQFQDGKAGGLDTIAGFRMGVDDLHLVGYAANQASAAVTAQTSDGYGGSLLQLADGTRIDLFGIAHATTGMFA